MTIDQKLDLILTRLDQLEALLAPKKKRTAPATTEIVHKGKVRGTYPCVGKEAKEFFVYDADIELWTATYPGIDVVQELMKAKAWLLASPKYQKTFSGMPKFLNTWLSRAQDKEGSHGPHKQRSSYPTRSERNLETAEDFIRRSREATLGAGGSETGYFAEDDGDLHQRPRRVLEGRH